MEPSIPDWLEQVEHATAKYNKQPELEVLAAIIEHQDILKNFVFPKLLSQQVFDFSESAQIFANQIIKQNLSLTNFLLELIKRKIAIKDIVKIITWDLFESLVEAIFLNSGWITEKNFRFRSSLYKRRFEIDVIAYNKTTNTVLLIDCKRYKSPSQAPIKKAAELQIERAYQLFEALPDMYDREGLIFVKNEHATKIYPMIITWRDHQMRYYSVEDKMTPIINITNLVDFVQNNQQYINDCFHITWEL